MSTFNKSKAKALIHLMDDASEQKALEGFYQTRAYLISQGKRFTDMIGHDVINGDEIARLQGSLDTLATQKHSAEAALRDNTNSYQALTKVNSNLKARLNEQKPDRIKRYCKIGIISALLSSLTTWYIAAPSEDANETISYNRKGKEDYSQVTQKHYAVVNTVAANVRIDANTKSNIEARLENGSCMQILGYAENRLDWLRVRYTLATGQQDNGYINASTVVLAEQSTSDKNCMANLAPPALN